MNKNESGQVAIIAMAIFILFSLGVVVFLYSQNQKLKNMLSKYTPTPSPSPTTTIGPTASASATPALQKTVSPSPKACTLEAKICPDGSAVGRIGPNCEFAPCP